MKKILGLLCVTVLLVQTSQAQFSRYIIRFANKGTSPYSLANPGAYLSQKAIDRRNRYNIAVDSTDLPVTPRYIDSVRLAGAVVVLNVSKWLNQITIQTNDAAALAKINSFPFVLSSASIAARQTSLPSTQKHMAPAGVVAGSPAARTMADAFSYGASGTQIRMHNGSFLHNIGLQGQGLTIAMLDGGYRNYLTLRAFDSARANNQISDTWDFVAREASVNEDDAHGMQCFSVIAANIPGAFVGAAPKAAFYLYRTEDVATEFPIEEHNWVCAAERADSAGGHLISSSLGYSDGMTNSVFDHTYAEMNGNTTIAARGADLAAKKGILVVNAAGNQGNDSFRFIATPADGDSVLAVGAVNNQRFAASFTSRGPSSDGQVKPDVASLGVGTTIQTTANTVGSGNGTSFAAPNIAGLAACLWQGFPEFNNIKIIQALRQAGSRFNNPNDSIGYGIPDMKKATLLLLQDFSTATASLANCRSVINFSSKAVAGMRFEVERKTAGESNFIKVGEVLPANLVFGNQSYTFNDTLLNAQAGNLMYRIRQVIDTSVSGLAADYIDSVNLNLSSSCVATSLPVIDVAYNWQVLPNPATDRIVVALKMPQAIRNLQLNITDARGSTVMLLQKDKPAGSYQLPLNIGHFAKGEYYLSLTAAGKRMGTKTFIKL